MNIRNVARRCLGKGVPCKSNGLKKCGADDIGVQSAAVRLRICCLVFSFRNGAGLKIREL